MSRNPADRDREAIETTIIVCVYNRPAQVRECLASLSRLQSEDFEILVVDDASTDETPRVVRDAAIQHSTVPIRIVRCAENRGVSGARNVGIKNAYGRFVAFTDSDCLPPPEWLGRLVAPLRAGQAEAVSGHVLDPSPRNLAERTSWGGTDIGKHPWQQRLLIGCNMAFRRDVLARYGFEESLAYGCDEDELAVRMRAGGVKFDFVPEAVVHHHHPLTMRSYFGQGWRLGQGVARFGFKHGFYVGRDLWALFGAAATAPLLLVGGPAAFIPVAFLALHLMALLFNEVVFKRKRPLEAIMVLAPALAYSLVKGLSVATMLARIVVFRTEPDIVASRDEWRSGGGSRLGSVDGCPGDLPPSGQ